MGGYQFNGVAPVSCQLVIMDVLLVLNFNSTIGLSSDYAIGVF